MSEKNKESLIVMDDPTAPYGAISTTISESEVVVSLPERDYVAILRVVQVDLVAGLDGVSMPPGSRIVMKEGHEIELANDGTKVKRYDSVELDPATVVREFIKEVARNRAKNRWVPKSQR